MTEIMMCGLCSQLATFEYVKANDELVCTCCGCIIDAMSDAGQRPFKLPLAQHIYTPQDFIGSMMGSGDDANASEIRSPPRGPSPVLAEALAQSPEKSLDKEAES